MRFHDFDYAGPQADRGAMCATSRGIFRMTASEAGSAARAARGAAAYRGTGDPRHQKHLDWAEEMAAFAEMLSPAPLLQEEEGER